jgi:hypothetical protein
VALHCDVGQLFDWVNPEPYANPGPAFVHATVLQLFGVL